MPHPVSTPVPSLYESVLAEHHQELPAALQRFHRLQGRVNLTGEVETWTPASTTAKLFAWLLGTPVHATRGLLRFSLEASPTRERWTRDFPGQRMTSELSLRMERVHEELGATRLQFSLVVVDAGLEMQLERVTMCGVPCPRWLMPRVVARETGDATRLHFEVVATLPLVGLVTRYAGHLDVPLDAQAAPGLTAEGSH